MDRARAGHRRRGRPCPIRTRGDRPAWPADPPRTCQVQIVCLLLLLRGLLLRALLLRSLLLGSHRRITSSLWSVAAGSPNPRRQTCGDRLVRGQSGLHTNSRESVRPRGVHQARAVPRARRGISKRRQVLYPLRLAGVEPGDRRREWIADGLWKGSLSVNKVGAYEFVHTQDVARYGLAGSCPLFWGCQEM